MALSATKMSYIHLNITQEPLRSQLFCVKGSLICSVERLFRLDVCLLKGAFEGWRFPMDEPLHLASRGLYYIGYNETTQEATMKLSARNVLKGKVKSVNQGAVNSEVIVELAGGTEVVSIITKTSAEQLKLSPGSPVYAVIKASNVMIAVD